MIGGIYLLRYAEVRSSILRRGSTFATGRDKINLDVQRDHLKQILVLSRNIIYCWIDGEFTRHHH